MYPNNVGRIILDGVMNAHEYYDGVPLYLYHS